MSEVKHTHGPLTAFKSTANFWHVVKGDGEYDPSVATVHPNYCDGMTDEECEANAFLFAAAPEMLEALEQVRFGLEVLAAKYPRHKGIQQDLTVVRAAIAKAEGRS